MRAMMLDPALTRSPGCTTMVHSGPRRHLTLRIAKEIQTESGQETEGNRIRPSQQVRDDRCTGQQTARIVIAVRQHPPLLSHLAGFLIGIQATAPRTMWTFARARA